MLVLTGSFRAFSFGLVSNNSTAVATQNRHGEQTCKLPALTHGVQSHITRDDPRHAASTDKISPLNSRNLTVSSFEPADPADILLLNCISSENRVGLSQTSKANSFSRNLLCARTLEYQSQRTTPISSKLWAIFQTIFGSLRRTDGSYLGRCRTVSSRGLTDIRSHRLVRDFCNPEMSFG